MGAYARVWWLDSLGGLILSIVVIGNWSITSLHHMRNLTGFSAEPDERNLCTPLPLCSPVPPSGLTSPYDGARGCRLTRSALVLYLTMRFSAAIKQIQNLRAYHAGDKLFVEVHADTPSYVLPREANFPVTGGHYSRGTHASQG